ncbi:MAG: DNA alkylation repair protein [Gammaproteobacteria bacterium]|nr:DNA alkylation repair protein [Gammaproteobacteria bacterium]MDH5694563.1 DNA alkylation repair protein [Gammaproteobacteria bacterium]
MAQIKASEIISQLKGMGDPERARINQYYFKTGKGEYAEGDRFLGIRAPEMRQVAKACFSINEEQLRKLIQHPLHEIRFVATQVLVLQYKKGDEPQRKRVYDFYLENLDYVNNWDLVDCSTPHVIGLHMLTHNRRPLYKWVKSKNLWYRRIAIMATQAFIREQEFSDTFDLAEILLEDEQDLIHKAVGWMLREVGKRDRKAMESFLKTRYQTMPRTMLRYAIEKLPETRRQAYLKGRV